LATQLTRLDNLAREDVDNEDSVIQVGNVELSTGKGSDQVNLGIVKQVVAAALETLMLLLLQHNDHIARDSAWGLISFAAEDNLPAIFHATINVDLKNLANLCDLAGIAAFALVLGVDDLSFTTAVAAGLLNLLHHRAHLSQHDSVALAITGIAGLDSAFLATSTAALFTDDVLLKSEFGSLALVQILQRDLQSVCDIFTATRA
jgi:hypothetical protein